MRYSQVLFAVCVGRAALSSAAPVKGSLVKLEYKGDRDVHPDGRAFVDALVLQKELYNEDLMPHSTSSNKRSLTSSTGSRPPSPNPANGTPRPESPISTSSSQSDTQSLFSRLSVETDQTDRGYSPSSSASAVFGSEHSSPTSISSFGSQWNIPSPIQPSSPRPVPSLLVAPFPGHRRSKSEGTQRLPAERGPSVFSGMSANSEGTSPRASSSAVVSDLSPTGQPSRVASPLGGASNHGPPSAAISPSGPLVPTMNRRARRSSTPSLPRPNQDNDNPNINYSATGEVSNTRNSRRSSS